MYPVLKNRPTWIEIDLQQLTLNLQYVKKQAENKEVWAVVKSDAYNHGIEGLFSTFVEQGITQFCVAQFDEAIHLQSIATKANTDIDILIFGHIPLDQVSGIPSNWRITVSTFEFIAELASVADRKHPLKIHLKIDSGMNRKGLKTQLEFEKAYDLLVNMEMFEVEGVYTHFSTSDVDQNFMNKQVSTFKNITEKYLEKIHYVHSQNSYGLLNLHDGLFNMVRPGGICYGMTGTEHSICKPIFNLYTTITDKKTVAKGEVVGYGNTYTVSKSGFIGVLPIGYADGWRKKNTGITVYAADNACEIAGKICMEQCMIFSEKESFNKGTIVELVGKRNNIFALAKYNDICDYEFVLSFLQRIPRRYIMKSKED